MHRDDEAWNRAALSRFPNLEVSWEPDVIVLPSGVADVIEATRFARENDLGLAVRGGGVGWVGARPGMLLLDLRALACIRVDPRRRRAWVQGGARWREVNRELSAFGLAAATAQFDRVGVAGHVLAGGHGWLSRRLGWASDTLRGVDLVTADGRLVHASVDEEPELFWALRGAGHNFGTVVGLELELIELGRVAFGELWFDPRATADGLHWCAQQLAGAPDELTVIVSIAHPPPMAAIPAAARGRAALHVIACHCGSREQAQRDLAGLRGHPAVVADTIGERPWSNVARGADAFAAGVHRRSRMRYVSGLTDQVISASVAAAAGMSPLSFMSTHVYGGAMGRVREDATAMSHRDEHWNFMVTATWTAQEDGVPLRAWQEDYLAAIAPDASDAYYVNYLFDEPERVVAAYATDTWRRLRAVKRVWDPDNVFAANHNIPPAQTVS